MASKRGSSKPNIWISPHPDGGWQKKREGSNRASEQFDHKPDAVQSGKGQAKKEGVELIIQGKDGKIQSKDSYGKDPNPPKDKEH